jgi:short-subunit dehydrogenase
VPRVPTDSPPRRRSICITGASRGIGRALALRFAGPDVYLMLFARDAERLEAVASACRQRGAEVLVSATDVADLAAFSAAVRSGCRDRGIDLAIVNAGVSKGIFEPLFPIDASVEIVRTNLLGAMHTISVVAREMTGRGGGHLAIVVSLSAFLFSPGSHGYCASKAGLRAFAKSVRDPLAECGVRLTEVYPGIVRTAMYERMGIRSPFSISAERAAELIEQGIERGRRTVFVPLRHFLLLRLAKALVPTSLVRRALMQSGAEVFAE